MRTRRLRPCWRCGVLALLCALPALAAAETRLLVIVGLGGEPRFDALFSDWATSLLDAARDRYGLSEDQLIYLSAAEPEAADDSTPDGPSAAGREHPGAGQAGQNADREAGEAVSGEAAPDETASGEVASDDVTTDENTSGKGDGPAADAPPRRRPQGPADAETIASVFAELAADSLPEDDTFVVLFGHGSARDGQAWFNIPGPDLSAERFAELLEPIAGRVAFVNTTPASSPFVAALAAPRRAVISATANPGERYSTAFGGYFVDAFTGAAADTDKDRRTSLLEAFVYARREVERFYDADRRLRTEHPQLDDNGDGEGSQDPEAGSGGDGALAAALTLRTRPEAAAHGDPARTALLQEQYRLQRELDALRQAKDTLEQKDYQDRLEQLLIELALIKRQLGSAGSEGGKP